MTVLLVQYRRWLRLHPSVLLVPLDRLRLVLLLRPQVPLGQPVPLAPSVQLYSNSLEFRCYGKQCLNQPNAFRRFLR
jgi:hypothetical protein